MITRTLPDGGNGSRLSDLKLDQALFDIEDLLQRLVVPFILLGKTAISLKKNKAIDGEKIEVGVKENDLHERAKRNLKGYTLEDFQETDTGFSYKAHGVPILVKIIKKNWKFFEFPDMIFYKASEYRVPNPIDTYIKSQHFVR